jgi:hypothetical protein
MRSILALISALLVGGLCFSSAQEVQLSETVDSSVVDTWEYHITIDARGNEITGLCIMNVYPDNSIKGTIINEFGTKIFDFSYSSKKKAKIENVIAPINKWYIRRVLKGDIAFILSNLRQSSDVVEKKRSFTVQPNGDISVSNNKYKIYYTLHKLQGDS